MVSVLRTLQAEWNALVPLAQARGIRRVRTLNAPLESIAYRQQKLDWLKGLLNTAAVITVVDLDALTFGIEIEMMLPVGRSHAWMASQITSAGIPCSFDGYTHTGTHAWKLVTDGSLGDYTRGAEVVSPILRGEDGFRQVMRVSKVLQDAGCKVSKRCGLHVHVGANDWHLDTFKNLIRLYASAAPAIDAFLAPSRRGPNAGNGFCKPMRIDNGQLDGASTTDGIARAIGQTPGRMNVRGSGRYYAINMQSFWQHGTIEFRQHQGTVEGTKIVNWTKLCLRMALAARSGLRGADTLDALLDRVQAAGDERDYFRGRTQFFSRQAARPTAQERRMAAYRAQVERERAEAQVERDHAERQREVVERNVFENAGEALVERSTARSTY